MVASVWQPGHTVLMFPLPVLGTRETVVWGCVEKAGQGGRLVLGAKLLPGSLEV